MTQPFRTKAGGVIDRSKPLKFQFDGKPYQGFAGDTLASALLANGVRLVGRSFKLHRPRGIFSAGAEEPNALAEMRLGARREPNTRMTMQELYDGLEAASQNRWPSLKWDLLSLNGLVGSALSAGFYYKTFMWPASFWEKVYEPLIRRAAGLGRASGLPDPDSYEAAHMHCDVLVVGSGAAGLAAARAAAATGQRVTLCEQDFTLGGGLLAEPEQAKWLADSVKALEGMANVTLMPRTNVFGYYDHNVVGAIERVADHFPVPPPHTPRHRYWTIRAQTVVLATGAYERFIAFPDNDRPGVMLAGAAQTYVNRFGVLPGERALLFANHDAAYPSFFALQDAGMGVAGVVDPRADSAMMSEAAARGIQVYAESEVVATLGGDQLRGAGIRRIGGAGTETVAAADLLCVSGGLNPAVHLASHSQTKLKWSDKLATFLPGAPVLRQHSVGSANGVIGIQEAAAEGAHVGAAIAGQAAEFELPKAAAPDPTVWPLWEVRARGKAFVDIQDDVTADDIRLAHREGFKHIEHAKRYTTHAMGTDQGKSGGIVGAAVLAAARGQRVEEIGLPAFRPFTSPISWGAIGGPHIGKHFAPTRKTALHAWHVAHDCVFMEAGQWLRPAYYPRKEDADAWASVLREARAVRKQVGICDVSTLGKIDVQGADAAKFLDLLYTNTFSTLKIGRARYGLMLREDGLVFDDGTTTRLAEDHFFMTTTTANAGPVMSHMEFHLQTCWPDFDVQIASVTDQWAAMSVAGPRARDTLAPIVTGLDMSNEAFPFMGVADAQIEGCPVRVFRISFSGELAYEVATPAGYADRVWRAIMASGEKHGITPYGVEALNLLRIEKGHVTAAELNGQTTAADVGLGRMFKKQGDFIGRSLVARPGTADSSRPRLVGLRPLKRDQKLRAGSHLTEPGSDHSLGWVTSVTIAVELEGWIGLAMLRDGESRIGTKMEARYPLANETVPVEIVSAHFVDPANERVHA
ncbi:MAG: sarcosine oxidase subunit alpha family protein [Elsteraceae bacterium]